LGWHWLLGGAEIILPVGWNVLWSDGKVSSLYPAPVGVAGSWAVAAVFVAAAIFFCAFFSWRLRGEAADRASLGARLRWCWR